MPGIFMTDVRRRISRSRLKSQNQEPLKKRANWSIPRSIDLSRLLFRSLNSSGLLLFSLAAFRAIVCLPSFAKTNVSQHYSATTVKLVEIPYPHSLEHLVRWL